MLTLKNPIPTGTLVGVVLRDPEGMYAKGREIRLQADVIDDQGAVYGTYQLSVADESCVGLRVNETPTGPGDRVQRFRAHVRGAYDRVIAVLLGEVRDAQAAHLEERQNAVEAAEAAKSKNREALAAAEAKRAQADAAKSKGPEAKAVEPEPVDLVPVPDVPAEPDLMPPLALLLADLGLLPAVVVKS